VLADGRGYAPAAPARAKPPPSPPAEAAPTAWG